MLWKLWATKFWSLVSKECSLLLFLWSDSFGGVADCCLDDLLMDCWVSLEFFRFEFDGGVGARYEEKAGVFSFSCSRSGGRSGLIRSSGDGTRGR